MECCSLLFAVKYIQFSQEGTKVVKFGLVSLGGSLSGATGSKKKLTKSDV